MSKMDAKNLAIAYHVKQKNMKAKGGVMGKCPDCMAAGGRCMAHGGKVPSEYPLEGASEIPRLEKDKELEMAEGDEQSEVAKLAMGGMAEDMEDDGDMDESDMDTYASGGEVLDSIMKDRKGSSAEPAYAHRLDLEPVHTVPDEEHDVNPASLDDAQLIGQILMDRKRRRGE